MSFLCSALREAHASCPDLILMIESRQSGSTRNQMCAYAFLMRFREAEDVGIGSVGSMSSQNSSIVRYASVSLLQVCQFWPLSLVIDVRIVFEAMNEKDRSRMM